MTFLNCENCLDRLVLDRLLKPALQLGDVETLASLEGGDDAVAVLVRNIVAFLLLSRVADLFVVPLALVHLDWKK